MMTNTTSKPIFYKELAYVFGMLALALGTSLMEAADYGVSMVVAPAYIIHLKVAETAPFFTFGMAEYTLQAVILVLLTAVLRRFKLRFLFSFATAMIYGFLLDGFMALVALIPCEAMPLRLIFFVMGALSSSCGVALLFHTYITPEAYELFVKEIAARFGFSTGRTKTVYDCVSCVVAVVLSFIFFGFGVFRGVKLGTVICALTNGWIIGLFSKLFENKFSFTAKFPAAETRMES